MHEGLKSISQDLQREALAKVGLVLRSVKCPTRRAKEFPTEVQACCTALMAVPTFAEGDRLHILGGLFSLPRGRRSTAESGHSWMFGRKDEDPPFVAGRPARGPARNGGLDSFALPRHRTCAEWRGGTMRWTSTS